MAGVSGEGEEGNIVKRLWNVLRRPNKRYSLGLLVIGGFVAGVLFWGAYNWGMELSNTETFCISCHEMESTVYQELKETVHYSNASGVRAICSDCHVPKEWQYKFVRKIKATFNELPKHLIGYLDTREKFESHRLELARRVWSDMERTDSRECRNCHDMKSMNPKEQIRQARKKHKKAEKNGQTCIECHKGIAHKLPKGWDEEGTS